jgi:hypothetical protein
MTARSVAAGGLGVVLAVTIGCWAAASVAAPVANVCGKTGITKAVATKIFGASAIVSEPQTTTGECQIATTNADDYAIVILAPKSHFKTDVAYDEVAPGGAHLRTMAVSGAGTGAVFIQATGVSNAWLFFTAGPYEVSIQNGQTEANGPAKLWEALARVIHSHLG